MEFDIQRATDAETDEIDRLITKNLVASNDRRGPPEDWRELTLACRDARGAVVGGLSGHTHWGWLFIHRLWVAENIRGRGCGAALVARAEVEARRRGCVGAWLDTFDFQAEGFYLKQGYARFAVLKDFPPGHSRYFLAKRLRSDHG